MTEEHVREDANKYELMVIVNPDIGMDAIKKRLDEIRKVLSAKKGEVAGEIFYEDIWGLRDLAYKIKKHDKGFYAVFDFLTDPSLIKEMENTLRLEPEVLRHMIVRLPGSYKTMNYAALLEKQAIEEEERKAQRLAKKKTGQMTRPVVKTMKPVEKKEEKKAEETEVKEEKKEEVKEEPMKEKPKKKETTLEDVDAKLKSIIDNPDINF